MEEAQRDVLAVHSENGANRRTEHWPPSVQLVSLEHAGQQHAEEFLLRKLQRCS
jgi:hypothetical protein